MTYPQVHDSARLSLFVSGKCCVTNEQAERCVNTDPALTLNHLVGGDCMALDATNARNDSAQPITDPLILQARFVNEAAALDRALAMRKALRPQRAEAARRGWENRHG